MFSRILVPTDFSEPSDAALGYARVLAAKFGSTIFLLHVVETPIVAGPLGSEMFIAETPAVQAERFEDARARVDNRITPADRARFNATGEIVTGTSAGAIVQFADERDIDLIVMGTHGRAGMAHLLMGSVAEKVVRTSHCPVLTVRQAAARDTVAVTAGTAAAPSPA